MIRLQCQTCEQEILLPDPLPKTAKEKKEFSQAWDKRYEEAQRKS